MGHLALDITAFRRIADVLPVPMWAMGPDGKLAWVNRTGAEFAGLSARELEADGSAVVHPDDMPSAEVLLEQAYAAGDKLNDERRIRHLDGRYRWMGVQAGPVRDADGTLNRVGGDRDRYR
jgi:PAS domain S-box-containing protein